MPLALAHAFDPISVSTCYLMSSLVANKLEFNSIAAFSG